LEEEEEVVMVMGGWTGESEWMDEWRRTFVGDG